MISCFPGRMDRCLAAKIMERSVSINLDMLPVYRKDRRGISRKVQAGIPDDPVRDDTDREMFAFDILLGKLTFTGSPSESRTPCAPQPLTGLMTRFPAPAFPGYADAMLGKDLLGLHFVCTECHGHEPAAEVVRVLFEDHGELREQVVGSDHKPHIARGCKPFDLISKIPVHPGEQLRNRSARNWP